MEVKLPAREKAIKVLERLVTEAAGSEKSASHHRAEELLDVITEAIFEKQGEKIHED